MSVTLKVRSNEDDALLFWSIPEPIPACRGFAIERKKTPPGAALVQGFLVNRIGFDTDGSAPVDEHGAALTKPSTEWPFQTFSWTDHDANSGDTVQYRAVPVLRNGSGALETKNDAASEWSPAVRLGNDPNATYQPFFNRGFVISQFMARYLKENNLTLAQFKDQIGQPGGAGHEHNIRAFLSGDLRLAMLEQLKQALKSSGEIFAALYELDDDELIQALCALKGRAHVVLSNGSITPAHGETTTEARKRDQNQRARGLLLGAGVDVDEHNRFISPGALGHNKFLVRTDSHQQPLVAWTGSTNWTKTGLCTQVNNGLLIDNKDIAFVYLKQWHRLREAQSAFPASLVTANGNPTDANPDAAGTPRVTVRFTRTKDGSDLKALEDVIDAATDGVLFLMFQPGAKGALGDVLTRVADKNLYLRGVVSTLPSARETEDAVEITLVDGSVQKTTQYRIVQPVGITTPMAFFAAEVTRSQFLSQVGFAIIHSKVLVIDPFSDHPVVITGSHNFSSSASNANAENYIIIRGDRTLAEAYAVNVFGAYTHYRWRAYLADNQATVGVLKDNDTWQAPKLKAQARDLRFFGV
jgi:phosphatidylserine/phosphatidylglycerophosphate/cardiolipin synthase-like enzyme